MLIGLLADIHAHPASLEDALRRFEAASVEHILCAGDIAGYFDELDACIRLLDAYRVECVQGNHDRHHADRHPGNPAAAWLRRLPASRHLVLEDRRIHLVHDTPLDNSDSGIRLLDRDGQWIESAVEDWTQRLKDLDCDILVVGHSHQVFARRMDGLLLINPGSTAFNHAAALLELPGERVEFIPLQGKPLLPSWNFGLQFARGTDTR
jgi:putative phosphoesterase